MNWYIGQPIVAIENHPRGRFKKGDEFVIQGIHKARCACKSIGFDIGHAAPAPSGICGLCWQEFQSHGIIVYASTKFAPLDVNISELTEILEAELVGTDKGFVFDYKEV